MPVEKIKRKVEGAREGRIKYKTHDRRIYAGSSQKGATPESHRERARIYRGRERKREKERLSPPDSSRNCLEFKCALVLCVL